MYNTGMNAKQQSKTDLAATIRKAVKDSGMTPYRIATDADVDRAIMTRFVNEQRGLTLDTASRLCDILGLELRPSTRPKGGK